MWKHCNCDSAETIHRRVIMEAERVWASATADEGGHEDARVPSNDDLLRESVVSPALSDEQGQGQKEEDTGRLMLVPCWGASLSVCQHCNARAEGAVQ